MNKITDRDSSEVNHRLVVTKGSFKSLHLTASLLKKMSKALSDPRNFCEMATFH